MSGYLPWANSTHQQLEFTFRVGRAGKGLGGVNAIAAAWPSAAARLVIPTLTTLTQCWESWPIGSNQQPH